MLIQGRFEEAAETAGVMLQAEESRPRARAFICHNQALALVQLGRVSEAQVAARAMLRALPSAAHMAVDLFALVAVREGRNFDAALMAGHSAKIKRDRDLSSDPAEAAIVSDTLQRLGEVLGADKLAELCGVGAAMSTADVLALALPP